MICRQIFISRDVVFHEEIFPFHSSTSSEQLNDPFPQHVIPMPAIDIPFPSPAPSQTKIPPISTTPTQSQQILPIRRSTKISKPPLYLKDFHCNISNHHLNSFQFQGLIPLSKHLSYASLSLTIKALS